uniref:Uncharacterized protein n=1 Tax=Arundo donax TaxID=35708 RepID=A0A0A9GMD8_ARUDO
MLRCRCYIIKQAIGLHISSCAAGTLKDQTAKRKFHLKKHHKQNKINGLTT